MKLFSITEPIKKLCKDTPKPCIEFSISINLEEMQDFIAVTNEQIVIDILRKAIDEKILKIIRGE